MFYGPQIINYYHIEDYEREDKICFFFGFKLLEKKAKRTPLSL
jgi:hypothetical protein